MIININISTDSLLHLSPFFARILNWEPSCLVISGGRFSKKEELVNGINVVEDDKPMALPGIFEQAVEYVTMIYKSEKDKLEKARQTDQFDLQLFQEYSEVLDEETMHYVSGAAEEAEEAGGEGGNISLVDMQKMLSTSESKKKTKSSDDGEVSRSASGPGKVSRSASGSGKVSRSTSGAGKESKDGGKGRDESNDGQEGEGGEGEDTKDGGGGDEDDDILDDDDENEEEGPEGGGNEERQIFLPTHQVMDDEGKGVTTLCLKLLKDARNRSDGRLNIKQQELDRNGSDKVQRAKRLAKKVLCVFVFCMYVHVCACVCMCVHVCTCTCMHVHAFACVCMRVVGERVCECVPVCVRERNRQCPRACGCTRSFDFRTYTHAHPQIQPLPQLHTNRARTSSELNWRRTCA